MDTNPQYPGKNVYQSNISSEYPENNIGLEGWKEMSVTEARWPRNTATGSGGGLLLILCSSLCSTCNWTDKIGFQAHLYWLSSQFF